ncbi:MAG: MCE family protein [Nocardioidaceae bacterium]
MISRTTKIQLVVFVAITLIGVSYVGAKYAKLDRLFYDTSYTVTANFAQSGGIFSGAEVTYRGVTVGSVGAMTLDRSGVDVALDIDNSHHTIPADVIAVVADRSAVGEQYVDLEPQSDHGPYLTDNSVIARQNTRTPVSATALLVNLDQLVNSVSKSDLRTVVSQLGQAFYGTGPDLGRIIDTSNAFITTAVRKLGVTEQLIHNSRVALRTQVDSESAIVAFTRNLKLFSDTLASSDHDLRSVIDRGGAAARSVRQLIIDNQAQLAALINNLITTGEIMTAHIPGIRQILVLYPYVVQGGYTVVAKDPLTGQYDAHFGLVLTQDPPVCTQGYNTTQRSPYDLSERPMNKRATCTEPASTSNARGAQHAPTYKRAPVVAAYDPATGRLRAAWASPDDNVVSTGGAQALLGRESWKWLLISPLTRSGR